MIATIEPAGLSALNILPGKITSIVGDKGTVGVTIDCGGDEISARITSFSAEKLKLSVGQAVFAVIKSVALER
jgi:molybdate transport system ATP-binding protein